MLSCHVETNDRRWHNFGLSSFFDYIGRKYEAKVFAVEKSRWFLPSPPRNHSTKMHLQNFFVYVFGRNSPLTPKDSPWYKVGFKSLPFIQDPSLVRTHPFRPLLMDWKRQVLGTILRTAYVKLSIVFFCEKGLNQREIRYHKRQLWFVPILAMKCCKTRFTRDTFDEACKIAARLCCI